MRVTVLPVLVVINLGLVGGLAALWLDEDFDLKNVQWRAPAAIAPTPDSLSLFQVASLPADVRQLVSTTDRPLFWFSRRPPPPPAPDKAAEPEPDPFADIHVYGLIDGGALGGAIIRTGGVIKRVKFGEAVGPWVLEGASGRELRFKGSSGEIRSLELKYVAQGAPAGGGGPQAAGAGAPLGAQMAWSPDGQQKPLNVIISERKARRAAAIAAARAEQQSRSAKK